MKKEKKILENVCCFRTNNDERKQITQLQKLLNAKTRSEAIKYAVMKMVEEKLKIE